MELLYWRDVRDKVVALNPVIAQELEQIKNVAEFRVLVARYPFGAEITKNGIFHLNYNNELIPAGSERLPPEVVNHLNYNWQGIPLAMLMHNTIEWHIGLPSHIIPIQLYKPGMLVSLLTIFENRERSNYFPKMSSIQAGCRSLILLPKVAHALYNERLAKRFKIKRHNLCPKTFTQQWSLFNDISSSPKFEQPWHTEILIFPKRFVQIMEESTQLKSNLLTQAWDKSASLRSQVIFDLIWDYFIEGNLTLAHKNTPFVVETAKHLVKIAMQEAPGFTPAIDDLTGPVTGLMQAYWDVYKIRYYLPIFMHIQQFDGINPVYYSLHHHTFPHPIPDKSNANQTIREIGIIKRVIEQFTEQVLNNRLPYDLSDSWLYRTLQRVEFTFIHPQAEEEMHTNIAEIVEEDARFLSLANTLGTEKNLSFPDHSVFFHGCVRIRPRQEEPVNTSAIAIQTPALSEATPTGHL